MYKMLNTTSSLKCINIKRYFSILRGQQLFSSQFRVVDLPNGIRVATKLSDSPLACTSLFVKTGPRYENSCNNGISHFIEHMAYQGFNSHPRCNLQENVYKDGVKLMINTTREYQVFTAISLKNYATECVEILSKVVTDLELSDVDIELQKKSVCLEALDEDNNPKSVVFDYLHQSAFQGTPLGQSVIGPNSIRLKFNKNIIREFIENIYQPHRLLFVTTGGISHSTNLSRINSYLGELVPNDRRSVDCGPQRFTGSSIVYRDDSMPLAHVAIAVEVPGYNSPEYLPLYIATCFTGSWDRTQGGAERNGSPLARAAATSMLCEKFESFYVAYQDIGLWGVYFVGNNTGLDDMVCNIQDQWMQMCNTIVNNDVKRAVNLAKLKLAKRNTGVINSCRDIGLQLFYTSKRKLLSELYEDMNHITDRTIRDLCLKYIYDKCPVVAAVGPTETLLHYGRIRSGMYWLRV